MKLLGTVALVAELANGLKDFSGRAAEVAKKPAVTMVSFDSGYQSLWPCWVDHMSKVNRETEVVVVSLDDAAAATVESWQKETRDSMPVSLYTKYVPSQDAMNFMAWPSCYYSFVYFKAVRDYLLQGHEAVLKTDLDAIPLKDPWAMLANASDADIITMPDSYPGGYEGGAFNTGFMLYRNKPQVVSLLNDIIDYWASGTVPTDGGCNDQFLLTQFINKRGCKNFGPHKKKPVNGYFRGNCGNIKVAGFADNQVHTGQFCTDVADCLFRGVSVMHTRSSSFLANTCGDGVEDITHHS
eukprot:gb/GFBE01044230.1/.p1 GENE.gb/GFBE01044230.1/~~gb/GFBE01044230.1/.p1  ORF type:complete len:297 (+),score=69.31 gb/GFBE01044230.1/:1-891(+)